MAVPLLARCPDRRCFEHPGVVDMSERMLPVLSGMFAALQHKPIGRNHAHPPPRRPLAGERYTGNSSRMGALHPVGKAPRKTSFSTRIQPLYKNTGISIQVSHVGATETRREYPSSPVAWVAARAQHRRDSGHGVCRPFRRASGRRVAGERACRAARAAAWRRRVSASAASPAASLQATGGVTPTAPHPQRAGARLPRTTGRQGASGARAENRRLPVERGTDSAHWKLWRASLLAAARPFRRTAATSPGSPVVGDAFRACAATGLCG